MIFVYLLINTLKLQLGTFINIVEIYSFLI